MSCVARQNDIQISMYMGKLTLETNLDIRKGHHALKVEST